MIDVHFDGAEIISGKKDGIGMLFNPEKNEMTDCFWIDDMMSSLVRIMSSDQSCTCIDEWELSKNDYGVKLFP